MATPIARRTVLGAGLAAVLAGCGGKKTATSSGSGGVTTLTYWSSLRGSDGVVAKFNESHPNIHVRLTDTPAGASGTNAKIYNAFKAGNAPDLITLEQADVTQFALDGVLADITNRVSEDTLSKLSPQAVGWATFAGRTYALPTDVEPFVMFYNKTLLEKYGLDVPTTWDEYRSMGQTLQKKTGGKVKPALQD
ncbi:extracellular solute-binding protein [Acidipropionibacterium acidipropionici]|uniref:ABC transporter substrate-binding protein n=1 Tax=Acidipropionibacterium acidipropionici TaxID=1748 RepID=UPI0009EDEBBD|nr:extracellular solute-binding protein [Acidipropionibacterium acidipropionici]AZP37031.1 extracellular solute-binding protein [Acidipropionibacterium acidipropionici]